MKLRNGFCFLALCLAVGGAPAEGSTILLNVVAPVQAGSAFDVVVQVTDVFAGRPPGELVVAYGFDVTIGNSSIQYTSQTAGSLFTDISGFPGGPMVAAFASNPAGIGPADFAGPLTLATLHFQALDPGATTIGLAWNSSDPNHGLIYASLPNGAITASTGVTVAAAAVPEPASIFLLGSGLVALFVITRREPGSVRGFHNRR